VRFAPPRRPRAKSRGRRGMKRLFVSLWLFIILVSVLDGYLVLTNRQSIAEDERNPVGRALIAWNQGDVWLLLGVKACGTIVAATVVRILYWRSRRRGLLVAAGLSLFQLGLLIYLLG
jgi:hypothetical protein